SPPCSARDSCASATSSGASSAPPTRSPSAPSPGSSAARCSSPCSSTPVRSGSPPHYLPAPVRSMTTTVTKTRFGVADRNAFGGDGTNRWRCRRVVLVLGLVALALVVLFLTYDIKGSWDYAIRLRTRKVVAMGVVGAAVAYSTVLFQTVTNNRILTPSIMGFDTLYLVIQTILVWSFGTLTLLQFDERVLFGIEVAVMVAFAGVLHRWLFGRHDRDLYVLVLVGIVLGTFFSSI